MEKWNGNDITEPIDYSNLKEDIKEAMLGIEANEASKRLKKLAEISLYSKMRHVPPFERKVLTTSA